MAETDSLISSIAWQVPVTDGNNRKFKIPLDSLASSYPYPIWKSGIDISSGAADSISWTAGLTVDYNGSDRTNLTWTDVDVAAGSLTLSAAQLDEDYQYVVVENGSVSLTTEEPTTVNLRSRFYRGVVLISAGAIAEVKNILIEGDRETYDILQSGGIVNTSLVPQGKTGTLEIIKPAGTLGVPGYNYFTDYRDPHNYSLTQSDPLVFDYLRPDGTVIATNVTAFNFNQVWNGTNIITLGGNNRASVQAWYHCPYRSGNKDVVVIGTVDHNNVANAARDYNTRDNIDPHPDYLGVCKLISLIAGRRSATDTTNQNHVRIVTNLDTSESAIGGGATISDVIYQGSDITQADPALYAIAIIEDAVDPDDNGAYRRSGVLWLKLREE